MQFCREFRGKYKFFNKYFSKINCLIFTIFHLFPSTFEHRNYEVGEKCCEFECLDPKGENDLYEVSCGRSKILNKILSNFESIFDESSKKMCFKYFFKLY